MSRGQEFIGGANGGRNLGPPRAVDQTDRDYGREDVAPSPRSMDEENLSIVHEAIKPHNMTPGMFFHGLNMMGVRAGSQGDVLAHLAHAAQNDPDNFARLAKRARGHVFMANDAQRAAHNRERKQRLGQNPSQPPEAP